MPLRCVPMTEIGHAIRQARRDQGMTIKELADRAGKDEATVGRIERGVTRNPSSADALQKVLGIGVYQQPEPTTIDRDPRLSEATFSDLLGALALRYARAIETTDAGRAQRQSESSSSGLVTPGYDGSRYRNRQEAERANHQDETG